MIFRIIAMYNTFKAALHINKTDLAIFNFCCKGHEWLQMTALWLLVCFFIKLVAI